jgi:hypothetical protein
VLTVIIPTVVSYACCACASKFRLKLPGPEVFTAEKNRFQQVGRFRLDQDIFPPIFLTTYFDDVVESVVSASKTSTIKLLECAISPKKSDKTNGATYNVLAAFYAHKDCNLLIV